MNKNIVKLTPGPSLSKSLGSHTSIDLPTRPSNSQGRTSSRPSTLPSNFLSNLKCRFNGVGKFEGKVDGREEVLSWESEGRVGNIFYKKTKKINSFWSKKDVCEPKLSKRGVTTLNELAHKFILLFKLEDNKFEGKALTPLLEREGTGESLILKKLYKIFPVLLIFISNFLFAQSPIIVWEKTIGNSKNDEAHKVILTSDQHYLIIGYTQPEGRYDLDLFITKINPNGDIVWKKNFGTKQVEIGYDIKEDAEGNFIAVGRANHPTRSSEVWVLKIDENGQQIWEKKYGLKNSDAGKSVFLTNNSQIIIGGEQEGATTTINHALWLVLDKNGNKLKEQIYGGDHFYKIQKQEDREIFGVQNVKGESCNKLIPSQSGGFLFAGHTMTKAKADLATDGWLVKLDEHGQLLWDKAFGAVGGDNLFDVLENKKGDIFTIGINYDKPLGFYSLWLSKFDASGNLIFEKKYGEKNFNTAKAGLLLENDNILICGFEANRSPSNNVRTVNPDTLSQQQINQLIDEGWQQFKYKGYENNEWKSIYQKKFPLTPEQEKMRTDRDAWLGQVDSDGNLIWKTTFGGTDDDEFFSIIEDHEGNLILAGYTRSTGNGLKDIWIVKLRFERA